ncbi:uncharacterized protein LTR77_006602 [Saxophila tyrrhenica]|uniref:Uncharacterized protein n=1 Tax=Saxophila tyrrhenica TaxID=1690608 RepID=A0AAV9P5R1_9PEZI|nr:hypothetical protein LTR77_006602 [Saxophila tyrrhenica]
MVRPTIIGRALAFGLLTSSTEAGRIRIRQPQATSASPETQESASDTATAPATTTTQDVPQALLSIADSLIDANYPSQTIEDIRTLSWPTTVVIGTQTYTIGSESTATSSSTPTSQTSQTSKTDAASTTNDISKPEETEVKSASEPSHKADDKRLAIIIGVVIGVVVLIVLGTVFCCLHRRKKDNGSFFLRRSTPSVRSNGSWMPGSQRPDTYGHTAYVSAGKQGPDTFGNTAYVSPAMSSPHQRKYPQMSTIERGTTPPVDAHPAYLHHESSRSTSDENPFYTPEERSQSALNPQELDSQAIAQIDHADPANRQSSDSMRQSRPPTPFSPLMMMQSGPAARPQVHQNPFSSPEDEEADDVVSPIVPPTRNPERRYSPMVHYPSWDEVSAFSFSGSERDARQQEEGGDGWRPERERKAGSVRRLDGWWIARGIAMMTDFLVLDTLSIRFGCLYVQIRRTA